MPSGEMLGSTFAFVFETQLETLQNNDRLYYLHRTAGLPFLTFLEDNSFASMIMANTDATHLPGEVFKDPNFILEVDPTKQFNAGLGNADPVGPSFPPSSPSFTPLIPHPTPHNPHPVAPAPHHPRFTRPTQPPHGPRDTPRSAPRRA